MLRVTTGALFVALLAACAGSDGAGNHDGRARDGDGAITFGDATRPGDGPRPERALFDGPRPDGPLDARAADADAGIGDARTPDSAPSCGGPSGWTRLGGVLDAVNSAGTDASAVSVAIDSSGRPVVAWLEEDAGNERAVYVARFDGVGWAQLGGKLSAVASASGYSTVLAAGPGGALFVGWGESHGSGVRPHLARWNESSGSWQMLGEAPGNGRMFSFTMGLVVDGAGSATIAWNEHDGSVSNVHAARWTSGPGWAALGGKLSATSTLSSGALAPSLALDGGGALLIAWQESDSNSRTQVWLRRFNGMAWTSYAGGQVTALGTSESAFAPRLVAVGGASPRTVAAFMQNDGTASNVYVASRAASASSWTVIGNGLSAVSGATHAQLSGLAVDSQGREVVAWQEDDGGETFAYVYRRAGGSFAPLGARLDGVAGQSSGRPALAIDGCDRVIVAADEAQSSGKVVFVWRHR